MCWRPTRSATGTASLAELSRCRQGRARRRAATDLVARQPGRHHRRRRARTLCAARSTCCSARRRPDAILVMNCPTALASEHGAAEAVIDTLASAGEPRSQPKPVLASWLGDEASREARGLFAAKGIACFATPAAAIDGFMQLVRHARAQDELAAHAAVAFRRTSPSTRRRGATHHRRRARRRSHGALRGRGQGSCSPPTASRRCRPSGCARSRRGRQARPSAGSCASTAPASSRSCPTTSRTSRTSAACGSASSSAEEAERAAEDMLEPDRAPDAQRPDRRLHRAADDPPPRAHELIVGMSVDATFGPLMLFGAGGTAVEVLSDTAHALPPLDLKLAHDLMRQTRIWRLLQGYRDRPAADLDGIAEVLVRFSYLITRHPEIREIDINPLLADDKGVIALDARVRVAAAARAAARAPGDPALPLGMGAQARNRRLGSIRIRPIRPEDEGLYERFLAGVTAEDRRLRFFSPRPDLSHRFLARLTQIDYAREMAFVALAREYGRASGRRPLRRRPRLHAGRVRDPRALRPQGAGPRLAADAAPHRLCARRASGASSTAQCWRRTPPCSACAGSWGSRSRRSRTIPVCGGCGSGWVLDEGLARRLCRSGRAPPSTAAPSRRAEHRPGRRSITCRSAPCRATGAARDPNSLWTSPAAARTRADHGTTCAPPCRARRHLRRGSGSG